MENLKTIQSNSENSESSGRKYSPDKIPETMEIGEFNDNGFKLTSRDTNSRFFNYYFTYRETGIKCSVLSGLPRNEKWTVYQGELFYDDKNTFDTPEELKKYVDEKLDFQQKIEEGQKRGFKFNKEESSGNKDFYILKFYLDNTSNKVFTNLKVVCTTPKIKNSAPEIWELFDDDGSFIFKGNTAEEISNFIKNESGSTGKINIDREFRKANERVDDFIDESVEKALGEQHKKDQEM